MISFTGNGLNIAIAADYNIYNQWMAFAAWYSINRNLPDAEVSLFTPKPADASLSFFRWARRANIKHYWLPEGNPQFLTASSAKVPQPLLVIQANVMAVNEIIPEMFSDPLMKSNDNAVWFLNNVDTKDFYEEKIPWTTCNLCCPCTSNNYSSFVSIDVCGTFNKNEWCARTTDPPFMSAARLGAVGMSHNEYTVILLWKKMLKAASLML